MSDEQLASLQAHGHNDFIGHTLQGNGRCKCGAPQWPHRPEFGSNPCFMGGGHHNFAVDGVCQDCGNTKTPE
jgi:hypothetical protein